MQRSGTETSRTQIQPSKPKREITKITNSKNTKRTYGQPSEQLLSNIKFPLKSRVHMTRFAYVCKFCIYAKFAYVRKSGHVYAFTHVCKICTYAKVGKFAPASDQVQISFCVYAKFAYMQIWSCEQKAKFAHVSIYLIVLNNC